ncbi:MAG: hypothetical protein JNL83_22965 [Myxococcales bacterium]|nr:hypothetical protein [Myxococcales bacterium]
MKLGIVALTLATLAVPARAQDTGMKLMGLVMRCPAISSDGKHVALYSMAGSTEPGSKTSLAVFSAAGKLEQRIGVVPPATDAAKAEAAATKIVKLLDDGGYKRMSRVARASEDRQKLTYSTKLTSEDVELEVVVKNRKVTITGTRAGTALAPVTVKLGAKDGTCKKAEAYDLANTQAGYDPKTQLFAFSVQAEEARSVCGAHDFVVTLRAP